MRPQSGNKIYNIQYLRFFAALLVVFHHARNPRDWHFNPLANLGIGESGVDFFFIISGFIMYYIARKESFFEFAKKRLIRVAPMYWLFTLLSFFLIFQKTGIYSAIVCLFKSLLFIPYYHPIENKIWPILIPGWTLNYEMFFYGIFAISIFFKRTLLLPIVVFSFLALAGIFFTSENIFFNFYTNPILIEFIFGLLAAEVYLKFGETSVFRSLIFLFPFGLAWFFLPFQSYDRVIKWGIGALLIILSILSMEKRFPLPKSRIFYTLGDASFSIYLVHIFVLSILDKLTTHIFGYGNSGFFIFLMAAIPSSIVAGVVVYFSFEKPITKWLTKRFFSQAK